MTRLNLISFSNMHLKTVFAVIALAGYCLSTQGQVPVLYYDKTRDGFLVFHEIRTDPNGNILPWYDPEPGKAYDFVIKAVWKFWDGMRTDLNGLPYYMNHQVWRPDVNDSRGLGGDQLAMALSSWHLLYQYTGWERVKHNMQFIADHYITHGFSPSNAAWASIPFPYNCFQYSGRYDGDMILGLGYTQPDKAGAFGDELVTLYQMTRNRAYLDAAIDIANTLAFHTHPGDSNNSPMPFKVNAYTGEVGELRSSTIGGSVTGHSTYTANWVGTLQLWMRLSELNEGHVPAYGKASSQVLAWMKEFPLKNNKWGPFFEDVSGWSDTQINAMTFARFMMLHPDLFPNWKQEVKGIFDWVYKTLGNDAWSKYGVTVVNEQTVYRTPGNSHTSRQAAAEILYAVKSGESDRLENAVRQLNWATYMVDNDGKNNYPRDEVWLTDGYGDYVRHFLRAMAVMPELAPPDQDHILSSTSVVSQADYAPDLNKRLGEEVPKEEFSTTVVRYRTFQQGSTETIRLKAKPTRVVIGKAPALEQSELNKEGWTWKAMGSGGLLTVRHETSNEVRVVR
jgi:hypothetical protein